MLRRTVARCVCRSSVSDTIDPTLTMRTSLPSRMLSTLSNCTVTWQPCTGRNRAAASLGRSSECRLLAHPGRTNQDREGPVIGLGRMRAYNAHDWARFDPKRPFPKGRLNRRAGRQAVTRSQAKTALRALGEYEPIDLVSYSIGLPAPSKSRSTVRWMLFPSSAAAARLRS
jgi:hypothetical protein